MTDQPGQSAELIEVALQEDGLIGVTIEREFGDVHISLRKTDAEALNWGLEEAIEDWEAGEFE